MSDRLFTASRAAQGFTNQAHLDRFYAYFDHTKACADCGKPASRWSEGDASWQPIAGRCDDAGALLAAVSA